MVLPDAEGDAGRDAGTGRTKILIVDDEEPTRYVLRQGLAAEPNWAILEAADGTEGLRLAQAETPDFIVLDLNMPGLDGFEVFRTLKGDPATRDIPILVVTSALLTAEVLKRLEGAIAVLPKSQPVALGAADLRRAGVAAGRAGMSATVILNVDDNEAARYAKTRTLERGGYTVIEARTGAEAMERTKKERPDLVLLDVRLPDISGYEVCRLLKATHPQLLCCRSRPRSSSPATAPTV